MDPRGQRHPAISRCRQREQKALELIAFQQVDALPRSTWPRNEVPQQLHLDTSVPSKDELDRQHERALALGARLLYDRSSDPQEPLRVYADLDGHPLCIFVSPPTEETAN